MDTAGANREAQETGPPRKIVAGIYPPVARRLYKRGDADSAGLLFSPGCHGAFKQAKRLLLVGDSTPGGDTGDKGEKAQICKETLEPDEEKN